MKNSQKPIIPMNAQIIGEGEISTEYQSEYSLLQMGGLTKREHFAGLAMQGLLANRRSPLVDVKDEIKAYAELSVKFSDELLKQLEN